MGYNSKEIKIIFSADGNRKNPFKKSRLKKFTSNAAVGINAIILPNPNYHTPKGNRFLPRKEEGGWLDKYEDGGNINDNEDIITDPRGQWAHPGEITKIPSGDITMQGVPYPVLGVDNLGNQQLMHPGLDYTFPGQSVTEYPQMQTAQYGRQVGDTLSPEGWGIQIRNIEHQIGNPNQWTLDSYKLLQDKLNAYKKWRENTPTGKAVVDYHNEPNEYVVPLPEHLRNKKYGGWMDKYQDGGETDNRSVAQMWQETTGLPWSAARAMGLSDGSYESNMKIREGLRRGDYDNIFQNMSYETQQSFSRSQTKKKQFIKVFKQSDPVKSVVPSAPISIPTKTTGLNKVAVPNKVISSVPPVAPINKVPVKRQPSVPTAPSEPFIWMKESSSIKKVKPVIPAVKPVTPISKITPPARVEPAPVLPDYKYPIFPKSEKKLPIWAHDMSPKLTEQLPVKSGIYIDKGKNIAYVIGENGEQITFPVLTGQNREGNISDTNYDKVYQIPKKERVTAEGFYILDPQQDISKLPPEERKAMMDEYNGKFRELKTIIGPNGEPKARTENTGFHQTAFMSNEDYDERVKAYEALDPRARDLSYGCTNAEECNIDYVNKIMPGADTVMVFDSKNNPNLDKLLRQKFIEKQQDYQYPIATGKYEQPKWSELRQTNKESPLSLSVNQPFKLGGWLNKYK